MRHPSVRPAIGIFLIFLVRALIYRADGILLGVASLRGQVCFNDIGEPGCKQSEFTHSHYARTSRGKSFSHPIRVILNRRCSAPATNEGRCEKIPACTKTSDCGGPE